MNYFKRLFGVTAFMLSAAAHSTATQNGSTSDWLEVGVWKGVSVQLDRKTVAREDPPWYSRSGPGPLVSFSSRELDESFRVETRSIADCSTFKITNSRRLVVFKGNGARFDFDIERDPSVADWKTNYGSYNEDSPSGRLLMAVCAQARPEEVKKLTGLLGNCPEVELQALKATTGGTSSIQDQGNLHAPMHRMRCRDDPEVSANMRILYSRVKASQALCEESEEVAIAAFKVPASKSFLCADLSCAREQIRKGVDRATAKLLSVTAEFAAASTARNHGRKGPPAACHQSANSLTSRPAAPHPKPGA